MLRSEPFNDSPRATSPDPKAANRDGPRAELAARLAGYQREIGASDAAVAAAEALADPDATVIVTGQQPGLLGGPLLTLAKALTAIAWAERTAVESGRPVIPVFWVASEDHDLDEVNRVDLLDATDTPHRLTLPLTHDGRMLSEVDSGVAAAALLDEAEALLPGSEFRPEVIGILRESLAPSLGTWFAGILARWLGDLNLGEKGLVVLEPRLIRDLGAPILEHEHRHPGQIAAAVAGGPVDVAPVPFFNVVDGKRIRPSSAADLTKDPAAVSWDVVTRVLAQDLVLPVAAQVVGPSEMLYCRQIAPAHEVLGIKAPPLVPRVSLTLVEKKVEKALGRFGTTVADVLDRGEDALTENEPPPGEFDRALTGLTTAMENAWTEIHDEAGRLDETLLRKAEGSEREIMKAIDRLRDHARRAMERVTGQDAERRRKVLAHLTPRGKPQDRVLSPLVFLARHGMRLIGKLAEVVREHPAGHRIVYLHGRKS